MYRRDLRVSSWLRFRTFLRGTSKKGIFFRWWLSGCFPAFIWLSRAELWDCFFVFLIFPFSRLKCLFICLWACSKHDQVPNQREDEISICDPTLSVRTVHRVICKIRKRGTDKLRQFTYRGEFGSWLCFEYWVSFHFTFRIWLEVRDWTTIYFIASLYYKVAILFFIEQQ